MAQLLVRNLEDDVKAKLQRRARQHGRSTEEEVREILRNAVKDEPPDDIGLGSRIAARFAGLGSANYRWDHSRSEGHPSDSQHPAF